MDVHPTQVEVKKSFVLTMVMIIFFVCRDNKKSFLCFFVSVYRYTLLVLLNYSTTTFGIKKLVLSSKLIKVELSLCKIRKADSSSVSPSNALYKTKFLFHSPTDAAPRFL